MSTVEKELKTFRCAQTGKEVQKSKLPRGWKEICGRTYSPDGWKKLYAVRGLKLAIGWPHQLVPADATPEAAAAIKENNKIEQTRLKLAVRRGLQQARAVFNWFMWEFYSRDRPILDDKGKLPKCEVPSLYQAAKQRFPLSEYTSDLLSAAENRARQVYTANRWEFAAGRRSQDMYNQHPYVVRAAGVNLYLDAAQQPRVKVTICRERFDLAIIKSARKEAPGKDNTVQWNTLVKALQDGLPHGECLFMQDKRGNIFIVVVLTLPVKDPGVLSGTFYVKSTKEELILALNAKEEKLWAYNGDQLKGWKAAHFRNLQRLAEDTKAEDRPTPAFAAKRAAMVQKFRNRVDTTVKQVAARIVGYAVRRKFATVQIDLSMREYFPRFDYALLERLVGEKCKFEGLEFVSVTTAESDKPAAS